MKNHLSIVMLYLITNAVLWNEKLNQNVLLRLLTTCNSISDWYTCQNDSSCTYLNGICSSSSTSTIVTDAINTSTEFQYWNIATSDGTVNMDNLSLTTLSLYQYSSSSYTDHPSCYWNVVTNSPQNISVSITRSIANNEDIYIQTQSQGGTLNSLTSKSFSNWRDSDYNLKIDNTEIRLISHLNNLDSKVAIN